MKIREYAANRGITYEAARQLVNRYTDELREHIKIKGNARYLDDVAIEILDEKRQGNPVVLLESIRDERIEQLEQENKELLLRISDLQQQLLEARQDVLTLQREQIRLLEEKRSRRVWWAFWRK